MESFTPSKFVSRMELEISTTPAPYLIPSGKGKKPISLSFAYHYPEAPCKEYLFTFPFECGHFSPNVGK